MRVAYICSNPDCGASTAGPNSETTKTLLLGVAAHITAASPGGARYNPLLTEAQRRHADNGVWLCQNCGKLVDNDENTFPEKLLRSWKRNAEAAAFLKIGKTSPFGTLSSSEVIGALASFIPADDAHLVIGEGMRQLSELYPDDHLTVRTSADGLSLELTNRDPAKPAQAVTFEPNFPQTEEGIQRAAEWDNFIRHGTPVELLYTDIPANQLPAQIRDLGERHAGMRIRLGAKRRSRPILVSLSLEDEGGEHFEFPYLDLRVVSGGLDRLVVSNTEQPIPFKFEIGLTPDRRADIKWRFELNGASVHSFYRFLQFKKVAATAKTAVLTFIENGLQSLASLAVGPDAEGIRAKDLELTERVLQIQQRTNVPLYLPKRVFFDATDEQAIEWFETVMQTGKQPRPPVDLRISAFDEAGRDFIRRFNNDAFHARVPQQVERLIDNDVDLGPAWVSCPKVTVHLIHESQAASGYTAEFSIRPTDGHSLHVEYERFATNMG